MKEITGEDRNKIFYILLALAVIVITVGYARGAEQDKQFRQDYIQYQQASQLVDQNIPDEAIVKLKPLLEKYPDSPILSYNYGLAYFLKQDYQESVKHMQSFIAKKPAMLYNKQFLVQYGEILYNAGQLELARRYLLAGINGNSDAKSVAHAQKLLQSIQAKTRN